MSSLLIANASIVNEGQQFEADLLVKNGRIEQIGRDLQSASTD